MQISKKQKREIEKEDIKRIIIKNYSGLLSNFYEMQSGFLSARYKIHNSLETANIIIGFIKDVHLGILRQREKSLDYNISLDAFLQNLKEVNLPTQKIVTVVKSTGIPKETVRRKINKLLEKDFIYKNEKNEYYWNLSSKRKELFMKVMENDIIMISKFVHNVTKYFDLNFSEKSIADEIKSQFSFYFYHFLSSQLGWFKMWQNKIKDIDLVLITLQALIPTLQKAEKTELIKNVGIENFHTVVGRNFNQQKVVAITVSATSISDVTGIPRATCMRKLTKLQKLGLLVQEKKTKRYFVNQITTDRTKNILTKDNISETVEIFSQYLTIIINSMIYNKK